MDRGISILLGHPRNLVRPASAADKLEAYPTLKARVNGQILTAFVKSWVQQIVQWGEIS